MPITRKKLMIAPKLTNHVEYVEDENDGEEEEENTHDDNLIDPNEEEDHNNPSNNRIKKNPLSFPEILHYLVSEASKTHPHIIDWVSNGEAFVIKDYESIGLILGKYFNHSRYSSLQRQLNMYGWKKHTNGPYTGAFFHPYFHRDHGTLDYLTQIIRTPPPRRSSSSLQTKKSLKKEMQRRKKARRNQEISMNSILQEDKKKKKKQQMENYPIYNGVQTQKKHKTRFHSNDNEEQENSSSHDDQEQEDEEENDPDIEEEEEDSIDDNNDMEEEEENDDDDDSNEENDSSSPDDSVENSSDANDQRLVSSSLDGSVVGYHHHSNGHSSNHVLPVSRAQLISNVLNKSFITDLDTLLPPLLRIHFIRYLNNTMDEADVFLAIAKDVDVVRAFIEEWKSQTNTNIGR